MKISCVKCKTSIGIFAADDDNGGVNVYCPKCKNWHLISNQAISYPDEWDGNDGLKLEKQDKFLEEGEEWPEED